jgi:hypothetical protein
MLPTIWKYGTLYFFFVWSETLNGVGTSQMALVISIVISSKACLEDALNELKNVSANHSITRYNLASLLKRFFCNNIRSFSDPS